MTEQLYIDVPQHVPNDDAALLIAWQVAEGVWVEADEIVCILEFSKATFDVPAARAGYLFHMKNAGEEVRVGSPLGVLCAANERPAPRRDSPAEASGVAGIGTPSRKAAELMKEHGLTPADFPGIDIIREHHVQAAVEAKASRQTDPAPQAGEPWTSRPHTPRQRRLIRTISESHRTIPHSWINVVLQSSVPAQQVRAAAEQTGSMVSLTDLLIYAVSRAAVQHPAMNACFAENETRIYEKVNVGIAMNMSNGDLLAPVIRDADTLSLAQIAGRARLLQKKSIRGSLTAEDMDGGTVTVTSLIGSGISQVSPIIVPGQSFIAAICDPVRGGGVNLQFLSAGFDHRVMNGSEAAACLDTIGKILSGEPFGKSE